MGSTGRVLVTPRSLSRGHAALERLEEAGLEVVCPAPGRTPTADELLAALPGCSAYLAGVEPVPASLIDAAAPHLRVIARNGVGVDNVDLAAAERNGVSVRPAYGANSRGVAELTIGLMLAAARHVTWSDRRLKAHAWERRSGFELLGRTLGVVGLGAIGRTVVELGAALGMTVVGHDVVTPVGWTPPRGFRQLSLPELAGEADVLSLHVPAAGRPVVDADLVARMRPGAVLVNTARGELVDTEPVLAALDEGRIAAYAVDAFETEPPQDWRLADHERVIATPHVGGLTEESVARAAEAAVDAILDALLPGQTGVT